MAVVGLMPNELVLRGGGLADPAVLTGLREIAGMNFAPLQKTSKVLHEFLTGRKKSHHKLADLQVIHLLSAARNKARSLAFVTLLNPGEQDLITDMAGSLDLDAGRREVRVGRVLRRLHL
jgi:hypothetical protein